MTKRRELRGIQLAVGKGNMRQLNPSNFLVRSQSNSKAWHKVEWERNRWICDCPDFAKQPKKCKHIYAVGYYLKLKEISAGVRDNDDEGKCPICGRTNPVIKRGVRHNRSGMVQRYYCKRCEVKFSGRTAFKGMKTKAAAVVVALDLYYRGLSLRQISEHLEASHGIRVAHGTVYYWLKKYVELVNRYVKNLRAETSERWHADETLLQVQGRHLVLWALLDSETRFLIATRVSRGRGEEDAHALIKKGLKKCEVEPMELVTDGLSSYSAALRKISKTRRKKRPLIHLQGPLIEALNNKMERFCGTVKARTKPMCGFNSGKSAKKFMKGFEVYYNFIKPHRSLGGKTPAQAAGLSKKKYTWLDLISDSEKT